MFPITEDGIDIFLLSLKREYLDGAPNIHYYTPTQTLFFVSVFHSALLGREESCIAARTLREPGQTPGTKSYISSLSPVTIDGCVPSLNI